jgi:glycosyltransferase involved in cell wall biosynthesis
MAGDTAPSVSLVVPCFNERPDVLERSLRSVMAQSHADFECILVDESPKAETEQACRALCASDPRFLYLRPDERLGLAGSLNLGMTAARGRYVARFDSDDICVPDRLALQVAFLDSNPDIGVLGGHLAIMDEVEAPIGVRRYPLTHDAIERHFQMNNAMAHPTVIMRRSVLQENGAYDPTFRFAEDLELWLRLINKGVRFANLDQVLVHYRQQQTRRQAENWRYNLLARRKNFSSRHLLRRTAGLVVVGTWAALPASVQEGLFRKLMFTRAEAGAEG